MFDPRSKTLPAGIGLCLSCALAAAPSAVASDCGWHVEPLTMNVTAVTPGATAFEFPLSQPVAMGPVSVVQVEYYRMTKVGAGSASSVIQLVSDNVVVANLGGVTMNSGDGLPFSVISRPAGTPDLAGFVDTIRLVISQGAGMTTTVQGMHPGDGVNARFVVAPFAPDGPHELVDLGVLSPISVPGGQTSPWQTVTLANPILASGLQLVTQTGGQFGISGAITGSGTVETQLIFDNQVTVTLDDWASPSEHQAAPAAEHLYCTGGSLAIDEETAAAIEGANLLRWRWRAHATGTSTVTFTPAGGGNSFISLMFDSVAVVEGDLDRDCIVGINDLLLLLAAWGPCGDCGNCPGDLNGDCIVGIEDLLMMLANWG